MRVFVQQRIELRQYRIQQGFNAYTLLRGRLKQGLHGSGVFNFFRQYKIDADADDGDSFILYPRRFNQNAGQFIVGHDQIVRPLDIYVQTDIGKRAAAGQCHHQRQRTQLILRLVKRPAQAEHQTFALSVDPTPPLPSAAFGLKMRHTQGLMCQICRLARQSHDFIVAGRTFVFQLRTKTLFSSHLLQRFFGKHSQRAHQTPLPVMLAQQTADMARHLLPESI